MLRRPVLPLLACTLLSAGVAGFKAEEEQGNQDQSDHGPTNGRAAVGRHGDSPERGLSPVTS